MKRIAPRCVHLRVARARGFTLIELLVVVAIIAMLISILLPSLGMARRKARAAKCGANLHSVGTAFQIYLAENGATYPYSYAYPYNWEGSVDIADQDSSHRYGYVHWSWLLFSRGAVKDEVFQCPDVPKGGLPRTNPGSEERDWEGGQQDQNGQTVPNGFVDKQAPRMGYTANAAIVPRNKFTRNMEMGIRWNKLVKEGSIVGSRSTILVTEWNKNWKVVTAEGNAGLVKSHRPVSAFFGMGQGSDEYSQPPGTSSTPAFVYGDFNANDYGLLPSTQIDELQTTMVDTAAYTEINGVGRHHPGGDRLGGTTNFLYIDGHVETKTVLDTFKKREWGAKYYSLTGPDAEPPVGYREQAGHS
jgi:prepilin-type N-terminal cleavage/methylation domain-containing protein/prepilin-type processing-associated H-X9-DG protein